MADEVTMQAPIMLRHESVNGTLSPSRHAARGCLLMRLDRPCRWERAGRRFRQRVTRLRHSRSDESLSEQLAELFRGNEGNTLGAEIARRTLPAPNGQQSL
jgi:hypothetical protein